MRTETKNFGVVFAQCVTGEPGGSCGWAAANKAESTR